MLFPFGTHAYKALLGLASSLVFFIPAWSNHSMIAKTRVITTDDSGLITTEIGGKDTFEVALSGPFPPSHIVQVPIRSSDPSEGQVSTTLLTFTPQNWLNPQKISIRGVNDNSADGDTNYNIRIGSSISADPQYHGLDINEIEVTNLDNDLIRIDRTTGHTTSENGMDSSFNIQLSVKPWSEVSIDLKSSDPFEGEVFPKRVTFNEENWNQPQTVRIAGKDDNWDDGQLHYTIITEPASSLDPAFHDINADDVQVLSLDNERAGLNFVQFERARYEIVEGRGHKMDIHINRAGNLTESLCVGYRLVTTPDAATFNRDFTLISDGNHMLQFGAHETKRKLTVMFPDDHLIEGAETITLELFNPEEQKSLSFGIDQTIITITDDETQRPNSRTRSLTAEVRQKITMPITFREHRKNMLNAGLIKEEEPASVLPIDLPEGASLVYDEKQQCDLFIWRPKPHQVGEHNFRIRAVYLNDETEEIDVRVNVHKRSR